MGYSLWGRRVGHNLATKQQFLCAFIEHLQFAKPSAEGKE